MFCPVLSRFTDMKVRDIMPWMYLNFFLFAIKLLNSKNEARIILNALP
jgi:hypothetical protein